MIDDQQVNQSKRVVLYYFIIFNTLSIFRLVYINIKQTVFLYCCILSSHRN
jgi:hypothetical protein